ncbi:hypothetical protein EDB92DRAFT_1934503 [Lactarius akahatsu]|uniref:Uncharacterized protein n=1 Tax=Lactarius akahatsu TaxID=416441 RepID=A0AAD4LLB9_9AGAM|nr:hypothetical protein EDB92DRAFT_1934503 [Lactarius akahatsu]
MSINTVPADILLEIADHLARPAEVLHLYLTSSKIANALTPALYSCIILRGSAQCIHTLNMLNARPDRARHVRSLGLCPDSSGRASKWGRSALPVGYLVSSAVRQAARNFEVLRTFAWDGEELPPCDDMWFALRIFCPRLKFISTSLGSILPPPNSHLFDFSDLYGFSLTFKTGFYWQNDGISRDEPVPGYDRLWNMLIKRCPNLEHLAIDGHSPHAPVDAHGLVRGRWPKLRSLLIGDVVFDWHVGLNTTLGRPFHALHLQSHAPSVSAPGVLADLHADALAKVSTFSGALVQAQVLPARASLKTLRVPDAIPLREGTPLSVSASLAGYDNGAILRAIVAACPRVHHLDFTIACRPSITVETFSRTIRPLGQLRTLTLRIVPSPGEDSLRACGARLVRASPRLSAFDIVFLARSGPHTLAWSVVRARASFVLAADRHGLPLALHVVERRPRLLWPGEAVHRVTLVMRPASSRRTSLLALVMERSPAGEEARLLLFCATLLAVIVWGCIGL